MTIKSRIFKNNWKLNQIIMRKNKRINKSKNKMRISQQTRDQLIRLIVAVDMDEY